MLEKYNVTVDDDCWSDWLFMASKRGIRNPMLIPSTKLVALTSRSIPNVARGLFDGKYKNALNIFNMCTDVFPKNLGLII